MAQRPEPGSDDEVLRLVAAGDAAALARLYQRHAGAQFGYLHRLAGDRRTAEEMLQDTMLAVWRSAGAFEGRAKVTTWLFGVAARRTTGCAAGPAPSPPERTWPTRPIRAPARRSWRSPRTWPPGR